MDGCFQFYRIFASKQGCFSPTKCDIFSYAVPSRAYRDRDEQTEWRIETKSLEKPQK